MLYDIKPLTSEPPGYGFAAAEVGNGGNRSTERLREPGGSADTCNSFSLYTETVSSTVKLMVGAGQIGTQYFAGKELGALSLKHGHIVYLEVDLDGTDGTYTVDVKTAADMPAASDTKKELVIGIVTATGAVLQSICGPYDVIVCRDWFVASAPFYTVSIRHTYNPMTFV